MENLYQDILNELAEREVLHYERYCPFYVISIGCHLFNLWNKGRVLKFHDEHDGVYFRQALLVDTRSHVFLVTPSGFGKTFHLRQFLQWPFGLIVDVIPCSFEGPMTEAAWTGTGTYIDGEPVIIKGAAWEYRYHIVGVEEFSAIVETMQSSTSKTLHPQLLTSLDEGMVRKRLRGQIKLQYETGITLWTGDRPATFNLASGMARRLVFLNFFPTKKDIEALRESMRRGENVRANTYRVKHIKETLRQRYKDIRRIEKLVYDDEVATYLDKLGVMPYEELIYKRLMIGYRVMRGPFSSTLHIYLDKTLKELLWREKVWRGQIRRGADISQVFVILSDHDNKMTKRELLEKLADFGLTYVEGSKLLSSMMTTKMIVSQNGYLMPYWRKKRS